MNAKIIAIIAVAVIAVAGVSTAVVLLNKGDDYYSTNSDCRLQILGNADKNDYLDQKDVDKINKMIEEKAAYDQMADANNDTVIDDKDVEFVKNLIELKKNNKDKSGAEKEKTDVWYITADNKVQTAKYPATKIICCNTQRGLDIAINIGAQENIVAINKYIEDNATKCDGTYMYRKFVGMQSIGDRGNPNLETISSIDADAIWAGTTKTYLKNVDANATSYGTKTIYRFATWENGKFTNGALMLGFFTDKDANAQKFVRWLDEVDGKITEKLNKIENKADIKFLNRNGNNYFGAQSDGVATAMASTGATNVGNLIILDTSKSGGYIDANAEAIIAKNPQIIFTTPYIYLNWDDAKVVEKFNSYSYEIIKTCDAVKNGKIYLLNYELPFPLIKMMVATLLFPEEFSDFNLDDYLKQYLNDYCDLGGTDYKYNPNTFYYKP